ncbi:hypothetical protein [Flaviflexus equikiangi]|uniref:hypothetical protein n=1 Tax=Flaviflexus equikiangi TaxID=2758573 RepID=UPI001C713E50|nr:hypothetical protein [Flaviflexus equikiangi]
MADNLVAPFAASPFYLVLAGALLALVALWIAWRVSRLTARQTMAPLRVTSWHEAIDKLDVVYGRDDSRVYALALAKLLRDFGTERTGIPLASLSIADMRGIVHDEGLCCKDWRQSEVGCRSAPIRRLLRNGG